MKGLRAVSQELESRQLALYKAGGRNQPIAEALRKHQELLDEIRSHVLPAEKYAAAESDARAARAQVEKLNTERTKTRTRLDELKRYQAALPTIDLLHSARQRLQPVADAPLLSSDFDAKLEDTRKELTIARSQLTDQEKQQKGLARQIQDEHPSAAILAKEDEIDELNKLVGADKKLSEEAVKAATFSLDEKGKARDIYRELTGTTDWEQMDRLKPRLDQRQRINELANEHAAVVENSQNQDKAVHEAKVLLAEARRKLDDRPAPVDSSPRQTAVEQIIALGPLEDDLRKRTIGNLREERSLESEVASFNPPVPSRWQESPALPVPLVETVEHFRRDFDEARRVAADVSKAIQQNQRDVVELESLLIDRAGAEPIPTVDALAASRRDRDGGLHCIRRRLDGQPDESAERDFIGRHAPDRMLMDAAENAVRQCDMLADRLRHEADRVAASVTLNEKLRRLQEQRQELDRQVQAAAERQRALAERWQFDWQASGVSPADPEIMQAWLIKWSKFCGRVTGWRNECQTCQVDQERIDTLREQLADACPAVQLANTLTEGLALAKAAIAQATIARAIADKCSEEVTRLQGALTTAERAAEQAEKRRDDWATEWSKAVAVLRLNKAAPSVKTAQDYLSRIDRMQQHLRDMRIKDARVREIEHDRDRLVDRVNRLRQRLDPASRPTTAETLDADFRSVDAALRDAHARRTRHEQLSGRLRKGEEELGQTAQRLREAEAALTVLAAEASP